MTDVETPSHPAPGALARLRASRSLAATGKLLFIGMVVYLLLGAIAMVRGVVYEREHRAGQVGDEIGRLWGQPQVFRGPILVVPYGVAGDLPGAENAELVGYAFFMPRNLQVDGELKPEIRRRGLFETVVYTFEAHVSGAFDPPDLEAVRNGLEGSDDIIFLWERASVAVGLTDLRGMRSNVKLAIADKAFAFRPGMPAFPVTSQGMHADLSSYFDAADLFEPIPFKFALSLNGSRHVHFSPVADETTVAVQSTWASPSFEGEFLPTTHDISDRGF